MNWYLGTMGFSYKDWEGVFYPSNMPPKNYLRHYSKYFNAVEIDSTFYGTPRLGTVLGWKDSTPFDFTFCLKTPRRITHELGLKDARAEMQTFLATAASLDEKLGVILIQLPPAYTYDRFPILAEFLMMLPVDVRFAVEFRHQSWYTPADSPQPRALRLFRRLGIGWAATDYPGLPMQLTASADFFYIRWIGKHGTYRRHDHERENMTARLSLWQGLIGFWFL